MNEPIKQCCKDWIEVNEHQAKRIAELEVDKDFLIQINENWRKSLKQLKGDK